MAVEVLKRRGIDNRNTLLRYHKGTILMKENERMNNQKSAGRFKMGKLVSISTLSRKGC